MQTYDSIPSTFFIYQDACDFKFTPEGYSSGSWDNYYLMLAYCPVINPILGPKRYPILVKYSLPGTNEKIYEGYINLKD